MVFSRLFADYLDHYFPGAGAIQLDEEYALIGSKLYLASDHRHCLTGAQQQVLEMGVAVR